MSLQINEAALQSALSEIDALVGMDSAKKQIKHLVARARLNIAKQQAGLSSDDLPRYHMIFSGAHGTGKSLFAGMVAKVFYALGIIKTDHVHEVERTQLVAGYFGETEKKVFQAFKEAKQGVLFIDDAYQLLPCGTRDFSQVAIFTLAVMMSNLDDTIVILSGPPDLIKKMMDASPALKACAPVDFTFEDYDKEALGHIMDNTLQERNLTISDDGRTYILNKLEKEKDAKLGCFNNGTSVRYIVDKLERALTTRLEKMGTLDDSHLCSDVQIRKLLTSITMEDVQKACEEKKFTPILPLRLKTF